MIRCILPVVLATGLLGCNSPDLVAFPADIGDADLDYVEDLAYATSDEDTGDTDTTGDTGGEDEFDDLADADESTGSAEAPTDDITTSPVALRDAVDLVPPGSAPGDPAWCTSPPEPLCAAA